MFVGQGQYGATDYAYDVGQGRPRWTIRNGGCGSGSGPCEEETVHPGLIGGLICH